MTIPPEAVEALRAFADFATPDPAFVKDSHVITQGSPLARKQLTMGDCRRARKALEALDAIQSSPGGGDSSVAPSGWRPIESAPRDLTPIIAWNGMVTQWVRWIDKDNPLFPNPWPGGWHSSESPSKPFEAILWVPVPHPDRQPLPAAPGTHEPSQDEPGTARQAQAQTQPPPSGDGASRWSDIGPYSSTVKAALVAWFGDAGLAKHMSTGDSPRRMAAAVEAALASLSAAPPQKPESWIEGVANAIVQSVCEMDDRTSPEDWPEAMLVTGQELYDFITGALSDAIERVDAHAAMVGEQKQ